MWSGWFRYRQLEGRCKMQNAENLRRYFAEWWCGIWLELNLTLTLILTLTITLTQNTRRRLSAFRILPLRAIRTVPFGTTRASLISKPHYVWDYVLITVIRQTEVPSVLVLTISQHEHHVPLYYRVPLAYAHDRRTWKLCKCTCVILTCSKTFLTANTTGSILCKFLVRVVRMSFSCICQGL